MRKNINTSGNVVLKGQKGAQNFIVNFLTLQTVQINQFLKLQFEAGVCVCVYL